MRSNNKQEFNPADYQESERQQINLKDNSFEILKLKTSQDDSVNYDKLMNFVNCYQKNIKKA